MSDVSGLISQESYVFTPPHLHINVTHTGSKRRSNLMFRSQMQSKRYTDEDMMTVVDHSLTSTENPSPSFDFLSFL